MPEGSSRVLNNTQTCAPSKAAGGWLGSVLEFDETNTCSVWKADLGVISFCWISLWIV
jgi:hypothetical protein